MGKGVYVGIAQPKTVMLLHGDDFTESAQNLTVTNHSVSVVDDTGAFGGKALQFSGSSQYLSIADGSLSLPGDFTVDFRIYNPGTTSWKGIFETAGGTSTNWTYFKGGLNISLGDGSNLIFAGIARGNGSYSTLTSPVNSVPVGVWSHIAIVRYNGVMTIYINGVSSATLSDSEAVKSDGTILIGKHDIRDDMYLNGKIDELRVSSVARWTSNFTPPTEVYPDGSESTGIARKVKKLYYGVENLAREVKKGYIGIGGVARPFWTSGPGEPVYYGTIGNRPNSSSSTSPAQAFNTQYVIFAGGRNGNYMSSQMDVFSSDLVLTTLNYPFVGYGISGSNFQNLAMFAGGQQYNVVNGGMRENAFRVFTYDTSLTRVERPQLTKYGDDDYSTGTTAQLNGNIFYSTGAQYENSCLVVRYDENFILASCGTIAARTHLMGSQNSNYAFFIGGKLGNSLRNNVDFFDSDFVKHSSTISVASYNGHGITIGDYACRVGGVAGDALNSIEAFDSDGIRSNPTTIPFSSEVPYAGQFEDVPFVKGLGVLIRFDSDFIQETYNYTASLDNGNSDSLSQQTLLPIGDYLVWVSTFVLANPYTYHAFKFS